MKILGLFDNLYLRIDRSYRSEFKQKIRRNNAERVYILSLVGLLFLFLLLLLDYLRYTNGVLQTDIIAQLLFYNHFLCTCTEQNFNKIFIWKIMDLKLPDMM